METAKTWRAARGMLMATILAGTMFLHDHFDAWLLIVLMHTYSQVACMVN